MTSAEFVLSHFPNIYLEKGYSLVSIDEVTKETHGNKVNRYVTNKHFPFFDHDVPMSALPIGTDVCVLVNKNTYSLYGIPYFILPKEKFGRTFLDQSEFFGWFNDDDCEMPLKRGYEVFRIVSEWEGHCIKESDFFSDVCDALEDTCNGGVTIDGDLDELFVVMKDKKPVQVLKYEPYMVCSDVPIDDFYADYLCEEDEEDPFDVK